VARLVERDADGRVMLVADGASNDATRVDVGPVAWRFAKGSQVGLLLSHTSWPKYRRWITDSASDTMRNGVSTVQTGPASWLTLGGEA
jgi:predicted acyl esterase